MRSRPVSPLLLFFITVVISIIAFLPYQKEGVEVGSLQSYYLHGIDLVGQHFVSLFLSLVVFTLFFIRVQKFDKKHSFYKKYILAKLHLVSILTLGFIFSYLLLLFIAFVELNVLSVLINANPKILGIKTDQEVIVSTLQANNRPPEIIASDIDPHKVVLAVAAVSTGKNSFFGGHILPTIPSALILPVKNPGSNIMLIDNTLIITEVYSKDIQLISPVIGYLFVKHYFPSRSIKFYPKIVVMDRQEYLIHREDDSLKKVAKIDEELSKIQDGISSLSATIQSNEEAIVNYENQILQVTSQRDTEYRTCLSGGFQANSQLSCRDLRSQWDDTIDQVKKDTQEWQQKLENDQKQLQAHIYFHEFFNRQKTLVQMQKDNTPHEFGIFDPDDSITIALDTNSPHAVADYLAILIHEYLHYTSYISSEKKFNSIFFEEGLTEYFTRRIIEKYLDTSTNLGYPAHTKLIGQMTNLVLERELADIYFTKNQNGLEVILNRVYGDDFYKNTQMIFEAFQYTADPDDTLKLANDIMLRIGGDPLTEEDLFTSYSSL